VLLATLAIAAALAGAPAPLYQFTVSRDWLTMPDGVRLAVTLWRPVPRDPAERFPVLLELLPYRKDDSFYRRDYPLYQYFVQRGYILAKVDVRGSGGSEGRLPSREYSDAELEDAVQIIAQLARLAGANGAVGMWGISWGGFNALQVAMRQPPGLKAILALHASDDLFHDDVHYIDGALHVDPYALEIDHENGLPRTPDYPLDSAYFADRFEVEPWIFTYLRHDRDGEFWRDRSVRFHPERVTIPVYLIGGLLDGYRDAVLRLLASLPGPVKAEIGPWEHDWPDHGFPGPNYEWRSRAVQWWDHWLKGRDTGLLREPRLLLFLRDAHLPSDTISLVPGRWRFTGWPISATRWLVLHPASGGRLVSGSARPGTDSLRYRAGAGSAAGDWWGDRTGDMGPDDAGSLIYDGLPLRETLVLAGFPRVELVVTTSAPLANWTVRLEDVGPSGEVALITGAVMNGTQLRSRLEPRRLGPGRPERLVVDLHFTTWTLRPGHRIRLAVANAQFPMIWPTPFPMLTTLRTGAEAVLRLPVVPGEVGSAAKLPAPEPRTQAPDAAELDSMAPGSRRVVNNAETGTTSVELRAPGGYRIGERRVEIIENETWSVARDHPAQAGFLGEEAHRIRMPGRELELKTRMEVRSDSAYIHARFEREIRENGATVRQRVWADSVPRHWH
jgi:predicted acyl esterase